MALGDTLDNATKNAPNLPDAGSGDVVPTDPAKNDMKGGRNTDGTPATQGAGNSATKGAGDSSLKIKIELDLDVEVHLTARVKGDITIGLL